MARNIFYGIKFPFTSNNEDGFFIDINGNADERTASEILHVILTPKGTRIRRPDFGTDLIKYIFSPNYAQTYESVKTEIAENVRKFVNGVTMDDIEVVRDDENEHDIYVVVKYSVTKGKTVKQEKIAVKI